MIKEIWGNGKDVIIKYTREEDKHKGIWIAASKWLNDNADMSAEWLIQQGYRRINYDLGR